MQSGTDAFDESRFYDLSNHLGSYGNIMQIQLGSFSRKQGKK